MFLQHKDKNPSNSDEARYVQDSVGIQIVKLNPISEEESAEEKKICGEGRRRKVPGSPRVVGE
jgi:hypothetical protein